MGSPNYPPKGSQVKRKTDGLRGTVYVSSPKADLVAVRWSTGNDSGTLLFNAEQFLLDWELAGAKIRRKLVTAIFVCVLIAGIVLYLAFSAH